MGEKVVALVPLTMSRDAAQATALAYQAPAATSVNWLAVPLAGSPVRR
ncbi:hypothetical protein [Evtepia gabavorous]